MRLLADENIPLLVVEALRRQGHDVLRVVDVTAGIDDNAVARIAASDQRVILTFDKGFGDLAIREPSTASSGVVLLRFTPVDPADASALVVAALAQVGEAAAGHLVVVERDRVRVRPLPYPASAAGSSR